MKWFAVALMSLSFPLSMLAQQAFTYQWYLEHGGTPAHGSFDFEFNLYDAPIKGAQVGPLVEQTLSPDGGVFNTLLDFGTVFDGTPLWLRIKVRPAGIGSFETIGSRVFLTPAPYAYHSFSAELELPYSGTASHAGTTFWIRNLIASGLARAVRGSISSTSSGAAGVYGVAGDAATSTTSTGPGGVVGSSLDEHGVIGHSTNSSGVFGLSQAGKGIYGLGLASGTADAVHGLSHGSGAGVYARSTTTGDALYAVAEGSGRAAVIEGLLSVGTGATNGQLDIYDTGLIGVTAGTSEQHAPNGSGASIRDEEGETVVYTGAGAYTQGGVLRVLANGDFYSTNYASLEGNYSNSGDPGLGLFGSGSTISFQTEFDGDDAVNFPANAVSPFESLAEAGAANDAQGTFDVDIGTGVTTILSRTITVPVSGYVIVIAGGTMEVATSGSDRSCLLGVSTSGSSLPATQQNLLFLPSGTTEYHPVTVHGLFSVSAGSTTFYYNASASAAATCFAEKSNLTLLFVPTNYGTIDSNIADGGPDVARTGRRSGLTPTEIALEQTESVQENDARIQNEIDEIRRRLLELETQATPDVEDE